MKHEINDKVRHKAGKHRGERGVITAIEGDKLTVRLDETGKVVRTRPHKVTNYSLAARKAWVTEPNRGVGRRKGTCLSDRVSVTLRLDRELWTQFLAMEEEGTIEARTAVVNRWFREKLAELHDRGSKS